MNILPIDYVDWLDEGKYDLANGIFHVTSDDGHDFYINYIQSRSGSYHSDYFYDIPELSFIEKEKYEVPTILYEFKYGIHTIACGHKFNSKDEYAYIINSSDNEKERSEFNSVEDAVKYVTGLNTDHCVPTKS